MMFRNAGDDRISWCAVAKDRCNVEKVKRGAHIVHCDSEEIHSIGIVSPLQPCPVLIHLCRVLQLKTKSISQKREKLFC